jgi:hypothetical protein
MSIWARRLWFCVSALAVGLLVPAPARAVEQVYTLSAKRHAGTQVQIRAGEGRAIDNRITVTYDRRKRVIVVRDPAERLWAGNNCRVRSAHVVKCYGSPGEPLSEVEINPNRGRNRVDLSRLPSRIWGFVFGGTDADTLLGGAGRDILRGNNGPDRIVGGRGKDELSGNGAFDIPQSPGPTDTPGDEDWIDARDGERDAVSCWASVDTVKVDGRDRVADGCERVTR